MNKVENKSNMLICFNWCLKGNMVLFKVFFYLKYIKIILLLFKKFILIN
jgi:hypothetical protein